MPKKKTPLELGRRERQLVETVQRMGEASVSQIREHLADPPSYSAVRTMLGVLVDKGWLKYRRDGKRYLYRPAASTETSRKVALRKMMSTFFDGSPGDAAAALIDMSAKDMKKEELDRLIKMINQAKRES